LIVLDMVYDRQKQHGSPKAFQKSAPETSAPNDKQQDHHHSQDQIHPD